MMDCFKYLLDAGYDVNTCNSKGEAAIHTMVEKNMGSMLTELLSIKGVNLNLSNSTGCTPLYIASRDDKADILSILLKPMGLI